MSGTVVVTSAFLSVYMNLAGSWLWNVSGAAVVTSAFLSVHSILLFMVHTQECKNDSAFRVIAALS